ncbi:MAG TPA: sigma-54 dependent transcriptional regulator [Oligoflexus sp.]|uniref:sigma-54-dependent transcriptional regulator n=1 Tax=Oligoflexus sp. TaxID=1971216 RepID=UPI002D7ED985|nr:sigma-54 dependent transcriptional regulator [Oligoflexus sp.]HET9239010.1 sigma-54 dependent transcriptional regulator [Oligoflexus sp.]
MAPVKTLLVIDDDRVLRYSIQKSLKSPELDVLQASTAQEALLLIYQSVPDVILLDLRLNETSGLDVLKEIKKIHPNLPVIMFTAFSTTKTAIEATKYGAFEYLLKPVNLNKLQLTIEKALLSVQRDEGEWIAANTPEMLQDSEVCMIGNSEAMQEVYKKIGRFAPTQSNILILGESGTGKELVAKALHFHSARRKAPFIVINCAALSENLLESELFGHEKGAFTGADRRRAGKFEYANGGTIFLDEIADMHPTTQAKVLRLLQDQRFERLGGNETIETDVRVIAATNRNMKAMIEEGTFRGDLYYRLNVFTIELPSLRQRKEDIPDLVRYFIGCFKTEFGKESVELDPRIFEVMLAYDWPGNMRELQSVVKYALAHADGPSIRVPNLPDFILSREAPQASVGRGLDQLVHELMQKQQGLLYDVAVQALEAVLLPAVLAKTKGRLQEACDLLGISRNTLKAKMKDHGISIDAQVLSKTDPRDQSLTAPH